MRYITLILSALILFPSLSWAETKEGSLKNHSYASFSIPNSIDIIIAENTYKLDKKDMEQWLMEDARLIYNPIYTSEIENINFCSYQRSLICPLFFNVHQENHIQKLSTISWRDYKISEYLKDLARSANRDPENAKLKLEDGRAVAFEIEKNGIKLNEEKSLAVIKTNLESNQIKDKLELPYEETKPEISMDSINDLGINTLIAEGKSNFRGSPKNRIHNIKVATKRYDGLLIKPGEEFSFVHILGEVDGEHGYLPELVIKKNKTELEFGGGVCQVSTTIFRAAIYAGLEITARRNHAYPVQYYNPQGMDATVYVPRPDLRFINNTPNYILVQPIINGTELVFQFYGTDDGRKVKVVGPTVTERTPDGGLKTTFTQQVFDKDENLIREDIFKSSYDSPSKYPHPATTSDQLKSKPDGWSDKEWKKYKKSMGL